MPAYKDNSLKKNKWYCQFRVDGKLKKKRGFKTRTEALEYEENYLNISSGNPLMKFEDYYKLFLSDKEKNWNISSTVTRKSKIENWILPFFKDYRLSDIDYKKVIEWEKYLNNSDLSEATKKTLCNILSSMFNHAIKFYNLKENPLLKAGSIGSFKRNEINFWTLEEYKEFISHIDKPQFKIAFDTLYYTGLRIGELKALTLNDFDFSAPKIKVTKTYQKIDGKAYIKDPKTNSSNREVYIPESLANEILELTSHYYDFKEDEFIFKLAEQTYRKELNRVCEEFNLKRIRIHDLRHSHASLLINSGYDVLMVSERLGHSSPKMTLDIYSHLFPSKQEKLARELDKIF